MKKSNLLTEDSDISNIRLATCMANILDECGVRIDYRKCARSTMQDIMDIMEAKNIAMLYDTESFSRRWLICRDTTFMLYPSSDYEDLRFQIVAEYKISWSRENDWSSEKC